MKTILAWVGGIFVVIIVIAALAGGGSDDGGESSGVDSSKATESTAASQPEDGCTNRATSDCTPTVGIGKAVRVDALYWRVTGVSTAQTLGDTTYGGGATADGTFVMVTVRIRSDNDETVTIGGDTAKLRASDGTTYDPDTSATIEINPAGKSLLFEDIGPDEIIYSTLVYDLPTSKVHRSLRLHVAELGLGEAHGFIRLPRV